MSQIRLPSPLPVQCTLRGLARELDWTGIGSDLLSVAATVLLADRLAPRTARGGRSIELSIPVHQPGRWRNAKKQAAEALSLLTGDWYSLRFPKAQKSILPWADGLPRPTAEVVKPGQVALFSGGLDSASAAALLASQAPSTAYVTHYTKGIADTSRLLADINGRFGGQCPPLHAQFYLRPVGDLVSSMRERTRKARSFFYVSLALATAASVGAERVLVCENGVLALNLPLSAGMSPTRHAHSEFLLAMERLAASLFDTTLRIVNPFELKTKGQMAEVFRGQEDLALRTVSCWNQQWSGRARAYSKGHCGVCLPCLVRLVSLDAAGIRIPPRHFDRDPRVAASRSERAHGEEELGMMRHLQRFAFRVKQCRNWREFVRRFPLVTESQPTLGKMGQSEWLESVHKMFVRFADEVQQALP